MVRARSGALLLLLPSVLFAGAMDAATAVCPAVSASSVVRPSVVPAATSAAGFREIKRPTTTYTETACFTDLSTVPDGTDVDLLVNDCGFQIALSTTTIKRSVPATWQRWGRPPRVESPRPDVLDTDGASTLILTWGSDNTIGGVEVQPRRSGRDAFQAEFFSGPDGTGELVGTVVRRRVDAPGGARLLAARSRLPWRSVVVTDLAGGGFAVAELRGS